MPERGRTMGQGQGGGGAGGLAPGSLVIVAPNYHPRVCGIGDNSMRLAQALRAAGTEASVLTFGEASSHPEAPEVPIAAVEDGTPDQVARALGDWLLARRPAGIILQFTAQGYRSGRWGAFPMAGLLGRLRRESLRCVLFVHEPFVAWSARPERFLAAALQRWALSRLAGRAVATVVTTETRRRLVQPWVGRAGQATALQVIRIGANALPVAPEGHQGFRLGTFSTLSPGKHLHVVLDAFARVAAASQDASLVLLGDVLRPGSQASEALVEAISRNPAAGRIRIAGRQSLAEVAREVAALDVFLFPQDTGATSRSSTLPTACGCGVPFVAIRGRETDGIFVDEENVLFAEALDGAAFAQAVERLRTDAKLARRLSEGALRLHADHLAWQRIASQVLSALGGELSPRMVGASAGQGRSR